MTALAPSPAAPPVTPGATTSTPGSGPRPWSTLWALMLAGRLVTMDYDRLTTTHAGWTSNAGSVLGALHQGPAPAGTLAARCGLRDSTVTGILDKLAQQGLVHRSTDPADRRRSSVALTDAGRAQLAALLPVLDRGADRMTAPLTDDEQHQLHALLTKLVRARVPEAF